MSSLRLSLCQIPIIWENPAANREAIEQLLFQQLKQPTDLLIFPEMFTTGFSMASDRLAENMDGPTRIWMQKIGDMFNCAVAGSLIIKEESKFYNRLIAVRAKSDQASFYDKKHLFTLANEHQHYSPGSRKMILELNSWKIAFYICYDLRFPVWCRNEDGADLIVFVANFPEKRELAWNSLLPARAIENQSFVAGVNRIGSDEMGIHYKGDSAVYDFEGRPMVHLNSAHGIAQLELDLASLQVYRRAYPFLKDRDLFEFK
ncbi:MAG: hypothetical protein IPM92_01180 [Saprospiraceae bacterium]|nr:hypothetical protein [Saprospiraceae bacterium]